MAAFNALPKPLDHKSAFELIKAWGGLHKPLLLVLDFASITGNSGAFKLSDRDWFQLLGYYWSSFDNVGPCLNALMETAFYEVADRRYYDHTLGLSRREIRQRETWRETCIAAMMNSDEQAAYKALPDEITLWRRCSQDARMGLNWTMDRSVAESSSVQAEAQGNALVLTAIASKRDIIAVKGQEVITWNPRIVSEDILTRGKPA